MLEGIELITNLQEKIFIPIRHFPWAASLLITLCVLSTGCTNNQIHATGQYENIFLDSGDLANYSLGFITPSTVTGQEQDIQSLAFIFARVLKKERPDIRVVGLPETLSAINQADLADEYKQMYIDYRDTGIFKQQLLKKVGRITGVRYLAQLKLSSFSQHSKGRFGLFGLRLIQTKEANIRLFLQIWDSETGAIAWEGTEELNYARDTSIEKPITFQLVVEEIAKNLVSKLP